MLRVLKLVAVLLAATVALIALSFFIPGPINAGTLSHSVTLARGSLFSPTDCDQEADAPITSIWTCEVYDAAGSGTIDYILSLTEPGASCWEAQRGGRGNHREGAMPKLITGCVTLANWLRPISRLLPGD